MIENMYTDPFEVWRTGVSQDGGGAVTRTPSLHLSGAGRLEPVAGNERLYSQKMEAYSTHRLYCPLMDIVETDLIRVNGSDYQVFLIERYDKGNQPHLEIFLNLTK